ncbi:hypothetical protein SynBIOSU31_02731 [Synechococcus sp. BIOS-U3-1]|nr:hypothetical protein SynBIOSU31_02731 [Synechococcus sp. BIOS-U3-1]
MHAFDSMFTIPSKMGGHASTLVRVSLMSVVALVTMNVSLVNPVQAQVRFDDCQPVAGGGITCNTVPYGNTRADMIDGEFGLMDQASPGWAEYNPYEGYDDMLGGNQT